MSLFSTLYQESFCFFSVNTSTSWRSNKWRIPLMSILFVFCAKSYFHCRIYRLQKDLQTHNFFLRPRNHFFFSSFFSSLHFIDFIICVTSFWFFWKRYFTRRIFFTFKFRGSRLLTQTAARNLSPSHSCCSSLLLFWRQRCEHTDDLRRRDLRRHIYY